MATAGGTGGAASGAAPFFEGTEKRIEIDFVGPGDLRKVPQADWEEVVRLSQTQLLHRKETAAFTSYLLSESSLIVYASKAILKTCGRTVPIYSISKILLLARDVGLKPEWLCYSRKNFLQPGSQPWEHQSKEAEIALCRQACGCIGDAYMLGPMTGEHWLIYNAEFLWTDCMRRGDFQVDIMMYDLPRDVQQVFMAQSSEDEGSQDGARRMTQESGLRSIADSIGGEVDDYCFAPCGYSCNVHAGDAYAMVHVTPQEGCSYASFETNFGSSFQTLPEAEVGKRLGALVGQVLDAFRPARLTMTLFLDQGASATLDGAPFSAADKRYKRRTCTSTHFEQDYSATIANYVAASATIPTNARDPEHRDPVEPAKRARVDS